jgi:hypothetical protein
MSETQTPKPASASAWKKNRTHLVTCPSGTQVEVLVPDIPQLIETGQFPQHLVDAAIQVASKDRPKPTRDLIVQQREFTDTLVKIMVVSPKLTDADLPDIPYEDKEMLVEIGTRVRDFDAVGDQLGGLHNLEKWRKFRGFGSVFEDVEDYLES